MFTTCNDLAISLDEEISKIRNQLLSSKLNILPPSLVEDNLFTDSSKEINSKIPEYELLLPINQQNILLIINFCKVQIVLYQKALIYRISVPLLSKDEYILYQLIPISLIRKISSFLIIPNHNYLAVEYLKGLYIQLDTIAELPQVKDRFLIQDPQTIPKAESTCESDVVFSQKWSSHCEPLELPLRMEKNRPLNYIYNMPWWQKLLSFLGGVIALLLMCCCCCPNCLKLIKPRWPGNDCSKCIKIFQINQAPEHSVTYTRRPPEPPKYHQVTFNPNLSASAPALIPKKSMEKLTLSEEEEDFEDDNTSRWKMKQLRKIELYNF